MSDLTRTVPVVYQFVLLVKSKELNVLFNYGKLYKQVREEKLYERSTTRVGEGLWSKRTKRKAKRSVRINTETGDLKSLRIPSQDLVEEKR